MPNAVIDFPPPDVVRRRRTARWVSVLLMLAALALAGAVVVVRAVDAAARRQLVPDRLLDGGSLYRTACSQCRSAPGLDIDWRVGLVWLLAVVVASAAVVVTRRHAHRS